MVNIVEAIMAKKQSKIKRSPCNSNRASMLGYYIPQLGGCMRRGVYERTNWQDKEIHTLDLQLIFDEGYNQEKIIKEDIRNAGFQIIEQETPYYWQEFQITGHVDGKIIDDGNVYPIEIKSMSPYTFAAINKPEDFNKKIWTRPYIVQLTLYLLMQGIETGIFILKDKSSGKLKQINYNIDFEVGEFALLTAQQINKHVANNTLPDRIENISICKDCPFKTICLPDFKFGELASVLDDEELKRNVDEYVKYKEAKQKFTEANNYLSDYAKTTTIDLPSGATKTLVIGNYVMVIKKTDKKTTFTIT